MDLLNSLASNILQKIDLINQDYVGFKIDLHFLVTFFLCSIFSISTIFLSYALGKKISSRFGFNTKNNYDYLYFIAIGYILLGSGIALLGFFSLLYPFYVTLFLITSALYSFLFPFSLIEDAKAVKNQIKKDYIFLKKNRFVFVWISLFVLLGVVNLINPEMREDQYHVDIPIMYLKNHTIMIPPFERIAVSGSPLIAEMYYTPGILFLGNESARYIHFLFYILVILALINFSRLKRYGFAIYAPILFSSAPVVLHETSSMYVDFEWIFCFLLSVLIIVDRKNNDHAIIKSGLLFGGMLATKLWTIVFYAASTLYLLTENKTFWKKLNDIIIFSLSVLLISTIWFIRAFVLTGNPIYPAFGSASTQTSASMIKTLFNFVGINYQIFNVPSFFNVFSPIFFISLLFLVFRFKENIKSVFELKLFRYLLFLLLLYISIHYPFGRYLLGLYVLFIFLSSLALEKVYAKFIPIKVIVNLVLIITFSYYLFNALTTLPYAFGIFDQNKYLSRLLVRDNSSYYDFGHRFNKYISPSDKVAMFNFHGYYYANFNYTDVYFIYTKNQRTFNLLKNEGFTKLLIRSGDIKWFCSEFKLTDCTKEKYRLISEYTEFPGYYLYNIN